jgi:alcohol dehydrogenase class IV
MKLIKLPNSLKDIGISEKDFYNKLDKMVELVFNDKSVDDTYLSKQDIKAIYEDAFNGIVRDY